MLMALLLSHFMGTCEKFNPKSLSVCFIHNTCAHPNSTTTYSTSIIDKETDLCFLAMLRHK